MRKLLLLVLVLLSLMTGCAQESEPAVISAPTADFSANPKEGLAPLAITFTDLSTGDVGRWHWDFGDGQFSNESAPSHTYTTAGDYTVSLAVMGSGGSDVETKVDYIRVEQEVIKLGGSRQLHRSAQNGRGNNRWYLLCGRHEKPAYISQFP